MTSTFTIPHTPLIMLASSLSEAKALAFDMVNTEAHNLLLPTDWMVIREIETNVSVPDEITTYRAAVRAEANAKTTKINSKAKLSTLQTYVTSEEFETWPIQGASVVEEPVVEEPVVEEPVEELAE